MPLLIYGAELNNEQEDNTTISADDEVWVIDLQATEEDVYYSKKSVVTASFNDEKNNIETYTAKMTIVVKKFLQII